MNAAFRYAIALIAIILIAVPGSLAVSSMLSGQDSISDQGIRVTTATIPQKPLAGDKISIIVSAFGEKDISSVQIILDSALVKTCTINSTRGSCAFVAPSLPVGLHSYYTNVTDKSGNSAYSSLRSIGISSPPRAVSETKKGNLASGGPAINAEPVIVAETPPNCTDTDSMTYPTKNFKARGTSVVIRPEGNLVYTDSCINSEKLREFYCSTENSNIVSSVRVNCTYGCSDGKCNSPVSVQMQSIAKSANAAAINKPLIVTSGTNQNVFESFLSALGEMARKIY